MFNRSTLKSFLSIVFISELLCIAGTAPSGTALESEMSVSSFNIHPFISSFKDCLILWKNYVSKNIKIDEEKENHTENFITSNFIFYQVLVSHLSDTPLLLQDSAFINSKNYSYHAFSHYIGKFTSCQIAFQEYDEQILKAEAIHPAEDPNFIVYFSTSTIETLQLEILNTIGKKLQRLPYSGISLFMNNQGDLNLLCSISVCASPLIPSSLQSMNDVKEFWKLIHLDLSGMLILRQGAKLLKCTSLKLGPGPPESCSLQLIKQKMNVTLPINDEPILLPNVEDYNDLIYHLSSSAILTPKLISNLVNNKHRRVFRQVISLPASDIHHPTPNTLKEVTESSYPVLTIDTFLKYFPNQSRFPFSQLLDLLQPEIQGSLEPVELPLYYKTLATRLYYLGMARRNISNLTTTIVNFRAKEEDEYAFVDSEYHVNMFGSAVDFSESRQVIKTRAINNFAVHQLWVIKKFYLLNRIEHILWQCLESGLNNLWGKNSLLHVQHYAVTIQKSASNSSYNVVGYIVQRQKGGSIGGQGKKEPTRIPLALIENVLKLCAVAVTLSFACFMKEYIFNNSKRSFKYDTNSTTLNTQEYSVVQIQVSKLGF
ncbi:unnamed protein product [Orchesella dallaii]|uniref:Uncharacterized protein n=1 Tax=Orchesella dallaii TaxID=48710 RepID=A0ABP1RFC7_9HEXA